MFQRKELERLHLQKEQLVLQSEANRQRLVSDWQRLQSPGLWLDETMALARRYPWWIAGLAAAAGGLTVRVLRQPRLFLGGIGRLGKFVSVAFTIWRLFRRKTRQP